MKANHQERFLYSAKLNQLKCLMLTSIDLLVYPKSKEFPNVYCHTHTKITIPKRKEKATSSFILVQKCFVMRKYRLTLQRAKDL